MTEKPIIFSTPMVRALLDGRKTQTRRLATRFSPTDYKLREFRDGRAVFDLAREPKRKEILGMLPSWGVNCPFAVDRLWVRETFAISGNGYYFRTDVDGTVRHSWRPAIHMPRSVARLFLDVARVRIEPLQSISDADGQAEGIDSDDYPPPPDDADYVFDYRAAYAALWDSLNAKRAPWASNPWVWVVEFRVARNGAG